MSLQFSNQTTQAGIIQRIETRLFGTEGLGRISSNTNKLKIFTSEINLALDRYLYLQLQTGGDWQSDDWNHTDFPTIKTNLVANQRDYTFVTDEQGNRIIEIHKVFVARDDATTIYDEIKLVDVENADSYTETGFTDGRNITGIPYKYNKKANGITLDPVPSYNHTNGLKIIVSREPNYFTSTDTTKKAGFLGIFDEYLVVRPSYIYARDNNLGNVERLKRDLDQMEKDIMTFTAQKSRDSVATLQANYIDSR